MPTFREFHDPRLVALYDLQDPLRRDAAFYSDLAAELAASSIVDVGCGTGAITCALAQQGYRVTGVDPAPAMLAVARRRPGGELVRWIEGDASALDGPPADLAIMTGHVAQVIGDDTPWRSALVATHAALRPGGHLAFDSRNPAARGWLAWTPEATRLRLDNTPLGAVEVWWQTTAVEGEFVHSEMHYRFASDGEELVSKNVLRFRTEAELTAVLSDAGFSIEHVFGDWDRAPVSARSPELIFVATRD